MPIFTNKNSIPRRTVRPLLALAILLGSLAPAATASASDPSATAGVYVGPSAPAKVQSYEAWRGRQVAKVVDFLADEDWSKISTPSWWISGWSSSAYKDRLVYSVPMLPRSTGTMQDGAAGAYNGYFSTLAGNLVAAGQGAVTIRLGWEMNGSWYRWSAAPDPGAYIAYWRHIVTAMRGVSGAAFRFEWSANMGKSAIPADQAYPGDAYVDTIGLDVYDQYWGTNPGDPEVRWNAYMTMPYGLAWHRDFAAAHGKAMTFPEWGVITRSDGYGGNDDQTFIQHMYDWIAANNVAWTSYFEYDSVDNKVALMGGQFPKSAAVFLSLFGPSSTITAPADTIAPVTTISCNGISCANRFSKSVSVTLTAKDAGGSGLARTRYTLDGSTPTTTNGIVYGGAFAVTKSLTVRFRSWDNAGNVESTVAQTLRVR